MNAELDVHAIAEAMAAALGDWRAVPPPPHHTGARLEHIASGALVSVWHDRRWDRLVLRIDYPRHPSGTLGCALSWQLRRYEESEPVVRLCPHRPAEALARDFRRRLAGQCLAWWPQIVKRLNEQLVERDNADQLLAELLGEDGRRSSVEPDRRGSGHPGGWSYEVEVYGAGVELRLRSLSAEQARAVLSAARQTAESDDDIASEGAGDVELPL